MTVPVWPWNSGDRLFASALNQAFTDRDNALAAYAPLASPTFSGAVTLPVANVTAPAQTDSSTRVPSTAWVRGVLPNGFGKNLLHNPCFTVAQRSGAPWTGTGVYTADRWGQAFTGGSMSTSVVALGDADRTAIGDEEATAALQTVCVGTAGAGDFASLYQYVEGVRRLAGKTVTLSGWAKSSVANLKLGASTDQVWGTGGSPSATVQNNGPTPATIGTAWTPFSLTVTLPSATGKTLGTTANTNATLLLLWVSAGATNGARSGNVGAQSATLTTWGLQLEAGGVKTPLEKRDAALEMLLCQRYYQTGECGMWGGYNVAPALFGMDYGLPTTMRVGPTVALGTAAYINASAAATSNITPSMIRFQAAVTATGAAAFSVPFTASAEW